MTTVCVCVHVQEYIASEKRDAGMRVQGRGRKLKFETGQTLVPVLVCTLTQPSLPRSCGGQGGREGGSIITDPL